MPMIIHNLTVSFEKGIGRFMPGDKVQGTCFIDTLDEEITEGLEIQAVGHGQVHWEKSTENEGYAKTDHYGKTEKYFSYDIFKSKGRYVLREGRTTFPFSFELPLGCPCHYSDDYGSVIYEIKSVIQQPAVKTAAVKHSVQFQVDSTLDLNSIPAAIVPSENNSQYFVGCCCCKTGPISLTLTLSRSGYAPGEYIDFKSQVTNMSRWDVIRCILTFEQRMTYEANGTFKSVSNVLSESSIHNNIATKATDVWQGDNILQVPLTTAPTDLGGFSKIIHVKHAVTLSVNISGPSKAERMVSIPVIIGSWTKRQSYSE